MEARDEYGVVGLGRMGGNLARQALEKDIRVVGFTRHGAPEDMLEAGLTEVRSYEDLKAGLSPPRAVLLYIPAGPSPAAAAAHLAARRRAASARGVRPGGVAFPPPRRARRWTRFSTTWPPRSTLAMCSWTAA